MTSRARLPGSGIAVLVPLCPVLLLVVRPSRRRFRSVKALGTFWVLVAYTDAKESLRGIQGTQRDELCRAAQWLKSSVEKLSEKGYEQHSERGLGRYKDGEMGRKVPSRRSVGLRYRRVRGFSDSFNAKFADGSSTP